MFKIKNFNAVAFINSLLSYAEFCSNLMLHTYNIFRAVFTPRSAIFVRNVKR